VHRYNLEPRALGRSDYPTELPLREVLVIAKHCAGGIILGFEQYRSLDGIDKPGTGSEARRGPSVPFPTPWNQLEAGILFGLGLPLLIFRESGISGGIFDAGGDRCPLSITCPRRAITRASMMSFSSGSRWSGSSITAGDA
jgi:hypothetical protein